VGIRDGKFFSFEDVRHQTFITGQNLAMFARDNPQYELQQLYKLSRGEIQCYENLVMKQW